MLKCSLLMKEDRVMAKKNESLDDIVKRLDEAEKEYARKLADSKLNEIISQHDKMNAEH